MRAWLVLPIIVSGTALVWHGIKQSAPKLKALEPLGGAPVDPVIPTHLQGESTTNATYCELLHGYRAEMRKWESKRDAAYDRMNRVRQREHGVCREFSWNEDWSYKYAGLFGTAGWTELSKDQPKSLMLQCQRYIEGEVKSPGTPHLKPPPTQGANVWDGSWFDVANDIRILMRKVSDAKAVLPSLRDDYLKAKQAYAAAAAKARDYMRKIDDLETRGVRC